MTEYVSNYDGENDTSDEDFWYFDENEDGILEPCEVFDSKLDIYVTDI
jgi:hypothetical protein